MSTAPWMWASALLLGHALFGAGCSSDDNANLASACEPAKQCQGCATCLEACACDGKDPTTCSTFCGGAADAAPNGCSTQPDCNACTACFDQCFCQTGNAQSCLSQCVSSDGGGGFGGFGGGAGSGGTSATGGVGATGGSGAVGGGTCATPFTSGSSTCDGCVDASCCSLVGACQASSACVGLQNCLNQNCSNTSNVQACFQTYCSQFGSGANTYNTLVSCIINNCNGSC